MEHSDELTFAEYFKSRYDLFRGLITFTVAMQWLMQTLKCFTPIFLAERFLTEHHLFCGWYRVMYQNPLMSQIFPNL